MSVLDVIESLELQCPDLPAVTYEGRTVAYADLARASRVVASELASRGAAPGSIVAVLAARSLELPALLHGVAKAGAAYLPLDPEYPAARLGQMLEDAKPSLILAEEALLDRVPAPRAPLVSVASLAMFDGRDAPAPARALEARSPVYVIFTSGSTGRPKGVINTHAGLLNRLAWMQKAFALGPSDAVLQKTPYGFDVSVWEFFWPFMTGARLVVARPGGHRDPAYLAKLIEQESVTVMHFVPSMLAVFLDQPALAERCRSLRTVVVSGEALSPALQNKFFEKLPFCELHNLYGPTEAAIDVTHWPCSPDPAATTVPIGHAIDNTQIHLLDESRRPVEPGEVGEIYIGGVQVALGYVNRPDLTAERFIDDPFSASPGAKLYRTGDLGRERADGAIEFLGRMDHQIKLRGNRIELGEIEARLESLDEVKRAVVLAIGSGEQQELAAYCQTADGAPLDERAVRTALGQALPDYMVPRFFVTVDDFPVTANGKLDRGALPAPAPRKALDGPPPRDDLERFIAEEWRALLGLDAIPRNVAFFELGGSSIAAARFVNRMQEALGAFIYIVSLFDAPTIEDYAAFLKREYRSAVAERFPGVRFDRVAQRAAAAIDGAAVARFESSIYKLQPGGQGRTPAGDEPLEKNPRAVFILAPPRSGTTLLRVMLAGHPGLFAAAELQLLCFHTLAERAEAFTGKHALWLEGTLRAIMELERCDAEAAKAIMAGMTSRGLSTRACFRELQDRAAPRMMVDKSPSYALDLAVLEKAEADFDGPLYIHLVRHPLSMIDSFVDYHMNQVLYLRPHEFGASELGELVWSVSHRNILKFFETVPEERRHRLAFEDMVRDPEREMVALCERLGLSYAAEMTKPYENTASKMTDGLHAESTPMGDTHFLERTAIDPAVAERWRGVKLERPLGALTIELAARFGYELPDGDDDLAARRGRARSANRARRRDRLAG